MTAHRATPSDNETSQHLRGLRTITTGFIVLAMLTWSTACQKVEPNSSNANSATTNRPASTNSASPTVANANQPTVNPETRPTAGSASLATPTEAYKAGYAARQNKDIATLKRVLSKDALEFLTEIAGLDKKTLDDQLKTLADTPQAPSAETRNEKITGNRASLEYRDEKGKWVSMDFSKEGNEWKIDLPKAP